tara:strand:+ start:2081 stop:2773 length:693 start_codon:yes stop_codon:yes gene_type:complete
MAEKRKDRKDMTHSEKIADHFRVLGRPNPFAAAHSGTPAQRKGGLGSNKGAARYERTSAEDRAAANSDGRYGYFDERNKRYVPALFDAMDGGGFDTRGDTFKGGIFSGMLNDIGIKPYGSEMERAMVSPNTSPIVQAVANSQNNVDPRVLTSRGFAPSPEQLAPPAATVMNQQVGANDALTFRGGPQTTNPMMASVMEQAKNLAARSGLNFDMMSQEQKAQYINAVMPLN